MATFDMGHSKQKAIRGLLRAAAPETVTADKVRDLRDRVLGEIVSTPTVHNGPSTAHVLAVACSVLIAAISMTTILLRESPGTPGTRSLAGESASAAGFSMARADDGSLLFEFPDTRVRQITMSSSPKPSAMEGSRKIIREKRFVDHSAAPKPGSVVFIRID